MKPKRDEKGRVVPYGKKTPKTGKERATKLREKRRANPPAGAYSSGRVKPYLQLAFQRAEDATLVRALKSSAKDRNLTVMELVRALLLASVA